MLSTTTRVFYINNNPYVFNFEVFKESYNALGIKRGQKQIMIELLSERTSRALNTIKDWIKCSSGPGDLETISIIEDVFNVPRNTFLRLIPTECTTREEHIMSNISDYERNVARKLYEDMCEMIYRSEYIDDELTFILYGSIPSKQTIANTSVRTDHEYQREQYILSIRKAGFDLPHTIIEKLISLVNKTYGPWNIDNRDMYFAAEEYQQYLAKNQFEDSSKIRYIYSDLFTQGLYAELNEIFSAYLHS